MTAEEDEPSLDTDPRPVRRGEGEVSQWPRGLVEYVTRGPVDEGVPSEDEDRTGQRLHLASRLIAVLRARGVEVAPYVDRLRRADRAYRDGDRSEASRLVDDLIGDLGDRAVTEFPSSEADR
ncbi:MAG: hypothetical protein HKL79_01555 [Thermoplasmata archaeon]|nr:hypothetical protein [Thermoplasmata archaeon]